MKSQVLMTYWVAIVALVVGLSAVIPNWSWRDEFRKIVGDKDSPILQILGVLTIVAGAFVLRELHTNTGGLWDSLFGKDRRLSETPSSDGEWAGRSQ